jgi:accessory gene regulator B
MIEKISLRIAAKIKETNPDQTKSIEIMTYSLSILINLFLTIAVIVIFGLVTGLTFEIIITLVYLMGLRSFSGGYHFKSLLICSVFSSFLLILIPFIYVSDVISICINLFSVIVMLGLAPVNFKETSIVKENNFIFYKIAAVCMVMVSMFFNNDSITIINLVQSASMINLRRWLE